MISSRDETFFAPKTFYNVSPRSPVPTPSLPKITSTSIAQPPHSSTPASKMLSLNPSNRKTSPAERLRHALLHLSIASIGTIAILTATDRSAIAQTPLTNNSRLAIDVHQLSKQLHTIADLPPSELQKVVNPQTLRWYSLRVPLNEIAPLNLSTSSPDHPKNHFYRVQLAYAYAQKYLTFLELHHLNISNSSVAASENSEEQMLVNTLQSTQTVVNRAIDEVAPHLICQHAEEISEQCLQWLPPQQWLPSSYNTLQQVRDVLSDLVEVKLGLTLKPNIEDA